MTELSEFRVEIDGKPLTVFAPEVPRCPSWCRHREHYGPQVDHEYDGIEHRGDEPPFTFSRSHVSPTGESAYVEQEEYARAGQVSFGEPVVSVWFEGNHGCDVSPDRARQYAAELLAAADECEQLR